ncbi:family 16 glycosylhydrolase [Falsirhodobacter sp. 20TX0035]|uniref:family 16 glycosylhydrolase n=1 Tax=Falsirhodobacter sp. 20TX0035 TaxID=3022019 RepID=UPI00232B9B82|nr:family 16 glycosylhydrolase [Falsirhodobacter sp. 20TX0035]MDB6454805.1 family 16 glycosylhydrolase [Falsirhodobacter sp. 20TX0035]
MITQGFRDDFTAPMLNTRRWYVSDGWTNGRHQDCYWAKSAVSVADGMLKLAHVPGTEAERSECGEVQLRGLIHYGTIEAEIRTPAASGLNASIFTYTGGTQGTRHDEIDIEVLTRRTDRITFNTFVDGKAMNGDDAPADPPLDEAFHRVAIQWGPDAIVWFVDGEEVHRTPAGATLPDLPQKLMMSFWSTTTLTDWMGKQGRRTGQLDYLIDWIAYTPLGETCLFAGSITC